MRRTLLLLFSTAVALLASGVVVALPSEKPDDTPMVDGVQNYQDNCPDVAGPASNNGCPVSSTDPFPGIRWYPNMGVYKGTTAGWVSRPTLVQDQYNTYVGSAKENRYLDLGDGDQERYWFQAGVKYRWRDLLVNENLAPTSRAQAQDPNWTNYKWNQNDYIDEMLDNATCVSEDKCKFQIFVATTATSEPNPVPQWLIDDPRDLTWVDGLGQDHVRLDKDAGWQAVADFLVALTKRYGDDPRIGSIVQGEYWPTAEHGGLPTDFNFNLFNQNMVNVWAAVDANAPVDASGKRVTFIQTNPITTGCGAGGCVTPADVQTYDIGVSGSDPHMFRGGQLDSFRQSLYGKVPLTHQVDTNNIDTTDVTWDGTPNPWGYTNGQTVPLRYEYLTWYHGSRGVIRLDSLQMRDSSIYLSQWHEGYQQNGPNGSFAAQWGQVPNYP